jgi:hypothetical protein
LPDLIGNNPEPFTHRGFIEGVVHPNALMLMRPVVFKTGEEMLARDDQDAALLEPLIQLLAGDGQILKPEPNKNSALWFMDVGLNAV